MNSLNFLDANVWLALSWRRHMHAETAARWFESAGHGQFFLCRFTQLAVLRLLTTEKILGVDTHTMASAWDVLDQIQVDERISFLPEPEGIDLDFRSRSSLKSRSPKIWADAYLLAFASVAGLKLVTFDRALHGRGADVLVL
jgi:toxin-antitoxin system PIN domain toxin